MDTLEDFATKNPGLEPADTLRRYSQHTKLELLKSGEWDDQLVNDIDEELAGFGAENGLDPKAIFERPEEDDLRLTTQVMLDKDPAVADAARSYFVAQSDEARAKFADPKLYDENLALHKKTYEDLITPEKRNMVKREAMRSGDLPFAMVDGALEFSPMMRDVVGNDEALAKMFDAYPNLDPSLLPAVKQQLTTAPGYAVPRFELNRQSDLFGTLQSVMGKDPDIAERVGNLVKSYERNADKGTVHQMLGGAKGVNSDPTLDTVAQLLENQGLGGDFSRDEIKQYVNDFALAAASPQLQEGDVDANVTKLSTGQAVLPMGVLLNKQLFDKTMAESKTIPAEQKDALMKSREARVSNYAPDAFKIIADNRPEFARFLTEKKEAGATNAAILDEWMSNPENHSSFRDYAGGIGESLVEGFGGLVLYPAALAGSDSARDAIAGLQKSDSDRRAYARLFGKNLSAGYDLSRLIAPVAADIGMVMVTGGAAAPMIAGKSSVKTAIKNTLRTALTSETKGALAGFTKAAAVRAGGSGTMAVDDVLTLAGKDIAGKLTQSVNVASFLTTAGVRSGGSTYVQLHTQLSDQTNPDGSKKYSPEQVREIALNHGLIAAVTTMAVTGGFSMFGKAGMEGIYNGITRKQLNGIYDRMNANWASLSPAVKAGISMESPEKMLESTMRKSLGTLWGRGVTGAVDEFQEEALDQALGYINQQIATGDKIDPIAMAKEAVYAGMLGGVMGGTVVGVNSMVRGSNVRPDQERMVLLDTAMKLDKAKSPQTAAVLRKFAQQLAVTDVDGAPVSTEAPPLPAPAGFTTETPTLETPEVGQDTISELQENGTTTTDAGTNLDDAGLSGNTEQDLLLSGEPSRPAQSEPDTTGGNAAVDLGGVGVDGTVQTDDGIKADPVSTGEVKVRDVSVPAQMTLREFQDNPKGVMVGKRQAYYSPVGGSEAKQVNARINQAHKNAVIRAYKAGERVPMEAAETYPEVLARLEKELPASEVIAYYEARSQKARVRADELQAKWDSDEPGVPVYSDVKFAQKRATELEKKLASLKASTTNETPTQDPAPQDVGPELPFPNADGETETLTPEEQKLVDRWDELSYKESQSKLPKGKKLTKAEQKELTALAPQVRPLIMETVDPENDPIVGVDTYGTDIRQSKKGTYYTVENGRIRTGPAFSEETPAPEVANDPLPESAGTPEAPVSETRAPLPETAGTRRVTFTTPIPGASPQGTVTSVDPKTGKALIKGDNGMNYPNSTITGEVTADEIDITEVFNGPKPAPQDTLKARGIITEGLHPQLAAMLSQTAPGGDGQHRKALASHDTSSPATLLASLAKSGPDKFKPLARLLQQFDWSGVTLTLVDDNIPIPSDNAAANVGGNIGGVWIPETRQILLMPDSANVGTIETALHEMVHAATEQSLKNPNSEQAKVVKRIEGYIRNIKKTHAAEVKKQTAILAKGPNAAAEAALARLNVVGYGVSDNYEFLAHMLTSEQFRTSLEMLPKGEGKSFVQLLFDAIADLLLGKKKIPGVNGDIIADLVTFVKAGDPVLGVVQSKDARFMPASPDTSFNQEVQKYVTGNWPSDPAGRLEELGKFADQWIARYGDLQTRDGERITVRNGIRGGGNDLSRSEARIAPDGNVTVRIGGRNSQALAEHLESTELAVKTILAAAINEEVIHAAELIAAKRMVGPSQSYGKDVDAYLVRTFDTVLGELDPVNMDAVTSSVSAYLSQDVPGDYIRNSFNDSQKITALGELVRQVIQLRRIGDTTELSFHRIMNYALGWMQKVLDVLSDFASTSPLASKTLDAEVKQTEAVLDELGVRFMPASPEFAKSIAPAGTDLSNLDFDQIAEELEDVSPLVAEDIMHALVNREIAHAAGMKAAGGDTPRLRSVLDNTTTGNPSNADRAHFIVNPEQRPALVSYLKGAANAIWDRLKERFDTRSAVYVDRLVAEVARAESGYRVTDGVARFMPAMPSRGDAEYLAAVEAGDMETAQRMVDEAAKAAGMTPLWRQGRREGKWWSESKNYAHSFGKLGREVHQGYLSDKIKIIDEEQLRRTHVNITKANSADEELRLWDLALKDTGSDGVRRLEESMDGPSSWSIYIVNPSQIKSADPVTRDSDGNVVPLSQRFNTTSPDIRFMPAMPPTDADGNLTFANTNFVFANDGNKLYTATDKDINEKPGWLTRMFARGDDMRKSLSAIKKGHTFRVNVMETKYDRLNRDYAQALKKEGTEEVMTKVREAGGDNRPMLTPEAEERVNSKRDGRIEAAYALKNNDQTAAKDAKDAAIKEAKRVHGEAMLSEDPGERAEAVKAYTDSLKEINAEFRRATEAALETATITDLDVEEAEARAEKQRDNARKQRDLSREQAKQDYDDEVQSLDAKVRTGARNKYEIILKQLDKEHNKTLDMISKDLAKLKHSRSVDAKVIAAINEAWELAYQEAKIEMAKEADLRRERSSNAMEWLEGNAPLFHKWAKEMRDTTNEFQTQLHQILLPDRPEAAWIVDNSYGVYITRTWRIHQDPAYAEMVLHDPKMQDKKDALIEVFTKDLVATEIKKLAKDPQFANVNEADLEVIARKSQELQDKAKARFQDLVMGHEYDDSSLPSTGLKTEYQRLLRKKNLDEAIEDILGRIDDPQFNANRTMQAVSGLIFNQKLLTAIKTEGLESGTIVDAKTFASDPMKYKGWKPLVSANVHSSSYAPLAGYYAPEADVVALNAAFGFERNNVTDTGKRAMKTVDKMILAASNWSLVTMTLGSVGYFSRGLSSSPFFMIPQGVSPFSKNFLKSVQASYGAAFATDGGGSKNPILKWLSSGEVTIEFREKMVALGILKDGVHIGFLRDLREQYAKDPLGVPDWIIEKGMTIDPKIIAGLKKGGELAKGALNQLERLADFTENTANVAIFLTKLQVLLDAKAYDTIEECEQEAARITKAVAPSKSERPQALKEFQKQSWSALIAPFAGFRADMLRITVNTYREAAKMAKSDNPVLRKHGKWCLFTAATMHAGVTVTVPLLLQAILGFDDEEDKALRAGMPAYSRGSQFWMWSNGNGSIRMMDLTFTNPWSFSLDMIPQLIRSRNNPMEMPEIIAKYVGGEMIGENIVAGSLLDVARNHDEQRGGSIWFETDDFSTKITKAMKHVGYSSYTPQLFKKVEQIVRATSRPDKADEDFYYTPFGIAVGMAMPTKPMDRKVEDTAFRAFRELGRANRELSYITGELTSKAGLGEGKAAELYNERMRATVKVAKKAHELAKAYQSMGLTRQQVMKAMTDPKGGGFSKERAPLYIKGFAEKYVLPVDKLREIQKIDPRRYAEVVAAMRKHGRYIDVR